MATLNDILKQIFPKGTATNGSPVSWDACPDWPPDLFALAATLVERSACYVSTFFSQDSDASSFQKAGQLGKKWANNLEVPVLVKEEWRKLLESGNRKIGETEKIPLSAASMAFHTTIMSLMIAADEAARNIGFMHWGQNGSAIRTSKNSFNWVYLAEFDKYLKNRQLADRYLPHLPNSLCALVSPSDLCVQPKGIAPIAGCSLSRFCNHLSLISSPHGAKTIWYPGAIWRKKDEPSGKSINILLIPFPYHLNCNSFLPTDVSGPSGPKSKIFHTQPGWLYKRSDSIKLNPRDKISAVKIAAFIQNLEENARKEVGRVHAVVLPECALDRELSEQVANILHKELNLALFITGFGHKEPPSNGVYFSLMSDDPEKRYTLTQGKHHPWYLDESQIRRYNLGASLPLSTKHWWESLEIGPREMHFVGIDHNVCMAVLVCEDLARIDPAQQALRAIGPNLVIGLLMDGPQRKDRWPARYATVLADEPGSSVLTLTSVGLIKRSLAPEDRGDYAIGLWKEFGGSIQELHLPRSAHALVLSLSMVQESGHTPDGRKDQTVFNDPGTTRLRLALVRPVKATKVDGQDYEDWLRYSEA